MGGGGGGGGGARKERRGVSEREAMRVEKEAVENDGTVTMVTRHHPFFRVNSE